MDIKFFLLSATLMTAMTSCWAFTGLFCKALIKSIFSADIPLNPDMYLDVYAGDLVNARLDVYDATLTDVDVDVSECRTRKIAGSGLQEVVLDLTLKEALLTSPNMTLSGILSENTYGNITFEDLHIRLTGYASAFTLLPPSAQFEYVHINLTLHQWFVNLEGSVNGTDVSAVLSEFLSMAGPELFEFSEEILNHGDVLLNFINCIFPPYPSPCV